MIIDAHHHFWKLARGDYGWLTPDLGPLYHDYGPSDLLRALDRTAVAGTVLVQAAPTDAETDFLLGLAVETPQILGVVGWAALDSEKPEPRIEALAAHDHLKGLRPMIQDIADPEWMLSSASARGFTSLTRHGLRLDALVRPAQLPTLARLADRHPDLPIVLDHAGKPDIAGGGFDGWAQDMAALAQRPNLVCKFSGLLTEAGDKTADADLRPYLDHLLDVFGPYRLMWGSDWPVLNLAGTYGGWYEQAQRLVRGLSPDEQMAIFGSVAARFYGLETTTP